jgi:DNA repair photolyase
MPKPPKINEIQAKTILTKSGLPGADWVINPYNGCLYSCMYCYAAQIARWKHPDEEWGTYLDIKVNAPEILAKELTKLEKKHGSKNFGTIFFSSVTDPYVGMEPKYKLTNKCLQELADFEYAGNISIQTKSPLVLEDISILKKLQDVSVGFTITSLNDTISQFLEVKAPPIQHRLDALKKLNKEGISTYAFIGPILPHFLHNKQILTTLLDKLEQLGVEEVWFEHINLTGGIKKRLYDYLEKENPNLIPLFDSANTHEYRETLGKLISEEMSERNLRFGLGKVIYHRDLPKKK